MRVSLMIVAVTCLLLAACGGGDETTTPAPNGQAGDPPHLELAGSVTLYAADEDDRASALAAGDFNGDGSADVVLGAAFADGPDDSREDAGEVLFFAGPIEAGETRDAAAGDHDAIIYGADAGDQAGRALLAADVNGDGIDDLVIGAPFGDGPNNDREDAGEAVVVLGRAALGATDEVIDLGEGAATTLYGPHQGGITGFSLAAGNFNEDRFSDVVISSFLADGPNTVASGSVHVVHGFDGDARSIDTAVESADVTVYGPVDDGWLGESVAAGDLNGDGLDDLVLPAAFAPSLAGDDRGGRVSILLSPLPDTIDLSITPADYAIYGADSGDQLGHSSATGDVDGDGLDDVLLGAVSSDGRDNAARIAGEAVLVFGSALRAAVDVAHGDQTSIAFGLTEADRLGRSVGIGDIDGDGFADILLGAPGSDSDASRTADSGTLYVIGGASSLPEAIDLVVDARAFSGDDAVDELTNGVNGRPSLITFDVDGDGQEEILVSASGGDGPANGRVGAGEAYILFVAPSPTP